MVSALVPVPNDSESKLPSLDSQLAKLVIGQPEAMASIAPFVVVSQAGLSPEDGPLGVALLLGPSGSGKTRTVEALAEILHGNRRNLLKVDCGEYQTDHEIAKLMGAPPGYLGHRETQPVLSQARINAVSSENSPISLVLFDEIEKSSPAMQKALLGILDKAILRLGDNSIVNFERCLIFLTSNLGSKKIQRASKGDFGFDVLLPASGPLAYNHDKIQKIGVSAVKRACSTEFVNRIDAIVTYKPLDRAACRLILDQIFSDFSRLVRVRLGLRAFKVACTPAAQERLLDIGVTPEFGSRELKRTVQRNFIHPLAVMVTNGLVAPGDVMTLDVTAGGTFLIANAAR